jgi:predicted ester cyclase
MDIFEELVHEDYFDHLFQQKGREEFKQIFTMAFNAFPDWHEDIQDIIAEGDKVWVLVKASGTHTKEWDFFGVTLEPTGKKATLTFVQIWRIVDGKMVEGWEIDDNLEFLRKLGVVEYTEKAKKFGEIFK